MQYRDLGSIDLKLKLLSGQGIQVDNLEITPYTLGEISNMGYTYYMNQLQWLLPNVDDFIKATEDIEKKMHLMTERNKLKVFDFFSTLGGRELKDVAVTALSTVFKTNDIYFLEEQRFIVFDFFKLGIFYKDEDGRIQIDSEKLDTIPEENLRVIHRDNFDEIIQVVKFQNGIAKVNKEDVENPADEETRKLMQQMKENREKVKKMKSLEQQDDDDSIDISDIISAVSAKSCSINKFNIWDLTLYQLYDEYGRLELIDNYDVSVRAIMAGAEKVDLKHWSSKI
ncbi:hypothetical protein PQE68_gp213 [Bacillus phage vB_BanS_Sophrita]|uniref:Uncharacterized protein n=1 Tax=Bacillus phage vB_BanS_Sophrita TaxID=2894790 RepID=A0AAE9CDX5_9CAUD|nr:hypothetical protein PQE68_gp213 [Bacillus phage vB_BanS_Sophrita]UGO50804.1 hypothetical protein SOPHRITA_213 [Bacillus phage vB_BanS_Sophrita]